MGLKLIVFLPLKTYLGLRSDCKYSASMLVCDSHESSLVVLMQL